jgi:ABC-type transport system involved in Fe-S cluster assembly fused permease/ATPase subunit
MPHAGALNRVIDRGTRGINWTLSSMVFNVVPTVFEVAMVSGILTAKCGWSLAALTCGTVGAYMAFTFSVTQVGCKLKSGPFVSPLCCFQCLQHSLYIWQNMLAK